MRSNTQALYLGASQNALGFYQGLLAADSYEDAEEFFRWCRTGFSDYSEQNMLNYITGQVLVPALPLVFLALFTTAPTSDSGAGFVEVNGTGYVRVQCAGTLSVNGTTSTSSNLLHFASAPPAWIVAGMTIRDTTTAASIPVGTTVTTVGGTAGASTITMSANAAGAGVGASDALTFSAFSPATPSVGAEPATAPGQTVNGTAVITFAQAGGNWGTVTSWGLFDGSAGGNLLLWDYLGNFKWIPFSATNASPSVLTVDTNADAPANGASCVVTQKYGGTLPPTGGSWAGILTSAGLSTNTFNLGVNTTGTGGGQFRQVTQQSIPANVTASFAASSMTLSLA